MLCEFFGHLYSSALPKVHDSKIHMTCWSLATSWKPLCHPQPHASVLSIDGPSHCGSQFSFLLVDSLVVGTVFPHISTQVHAVLYTPLFSSSFPTRITILNRRTNISISILRNSDESNLTPNVGWRRTLSLIQNTYYRKVANSMKFQKVYWVQVGAIFYKSLINIAVNYLVSPSSSPSQGREICNIVSLKHWKPP